MKSYLKGVRGFFTVIFFCAIITGILNGFVFIANAWPKSTVLVLFILFIVLSPLAYMEKQD